MSEFSVKKNALIEKAPAEKMGDQIQAQIHFARWTMLRGQICGSAWGQILIGGHGNLAFQILGF